MKTTDLPGDLTCSENFDLVVVGGGLAGLCMALGAAREGAQVALVHDRPMLGGNSSSEVRVVPAGSSSHSAWAREIGIVEELLLKDRATNHQQFFENGLTNSLYDLALLDSARSQPNLKLFLNTTVIAADTRLSGPGERTITSVVGHQLTTGKRITFSAGAFADCTGDGNLGFLAGAEWRYGRESRSEFRESLAPSVADRVTSGATIALRARKSDKPAPFTSPVPIQLYVDEAEIGSGRTLRNIDLDDFGGFWWLEVGYPFDQVSDTEEVRDELHRHVLGVWNYLKNYHPRKDDLAYHVLEWVGMLPGKRESRRIVGDVLVTEHDCHDDARWPDRIGTAGWYIDLHAKGGILNTGDPGEPSFIDENYRAWTRVAPYTVPLRACYSRNVNNLWIGGRCMSATHIANGSLRVQQTLGAIGQAVGIAAAIALAEGVRPRDVAAPESRLLCKVQRRVLERDIRVLGCRRGENDRLGGLTTAASSEACLDFGDPLKANPVSLEKPQAQVIPLSASRLDYIEVYLSNTARSAGIVKARLESVPVLWHDSDGKTAAELELRVPARAEGWMRLDPGGRVAAEGLVRLSLAGSAGIFWHQASSMPTGTVSQRLHVSQGGVEEKNRKYSAFASDQLELPSFKRWVQNKSISLACRFGPEQRPFPARSVVNGTDFPETMPNLWVSDPAQPLPQSIWIEFAGQLVENVELIFDTGLNASVGRAPGFWRAPEVVSEYELELRIDSRWRVIHAARGNYQRRNLIAFSPQRADGVRLTILGTGRPPYPIPPREFAAWRGDGEYYERQQGSSALGARVYGIHVNVTPERT